MPNDWSWITGHLFMLQKFTDRLPPDANVNLALADLCMEFKDTEVLLMDYWPVYPPLFLVHSPEVAMQVSTELNLPKTEQIGKSLLPITGGQSLISMNGDEWKMWRNLFNPGFSAASMRDNVPHIVNYVMVFSELLRDKAGKDIVCLDELTTRLTMDIVIKVTMSVFPSF
jgi:cytochrome P450